MSLRTEEEMSALQLDLEEELEQEDTSRERQLWAEWKGRPSAVDEDHELALQQLKGRVDQSLVAVQKHALMIIQSVSTAEILITLSQERTQCESGGTKCAVEQWLGSGSTSILVIPPRTGSVVRSCRGIKGVCPLINPNSFLSAGRNNLTVTESAGRQTLGRDTEWRDETASVSIVLSTGCVRQSVSADTEIRDHPSVRTEDVSSVGREDIRPPDCRRLWLDLMGPWTSDNSELPAGLSIEALFIKQDVAKALGLVGKAHPVSVVGIGREKNTECYLLEPLIMPKSCNDLHIARVSVVHWEDTRFVELVADVSTDKEDIPVMNGIDNYCRFIRNAI
ncbi:hypothetical protein T05_1748 [Trichinella murrelli]|uniref:Uncharacterized protein n=1 Tax=Trichinella murrelli TaxID=144512 RepID=A0A0V0U1J3_9BILA|nr:hypothetical protein T05_1748 [Trichinella murrelli]